MPWLARRTHLRFAEKRVGQLASHLRIRPGARRVEWALKAGAARTAHRARSNIEGDAALPRAEFFALLGLFIVQDFLDTDTCARLLAEVRAAHKVPVAVTQAERGQTIDESWRKTRQVNVSATATALVKARLFGLLPRIESHFKLSIARCQEPEFLAYHPGDFFQERSAVGDHPDVPAAVKPRSVSAVVFLNGESAEP